MSLYRVPCQWTVYGTMFIEADSPLEAAELADSQSDDEGLPTSTDYSEGSFMVFPEEITLEEEDGGTDDEE